MRDMLPRKTTTAVADIKKGLKDSLYGNGMSSASPTPSGESSSPAQDISEGAPNCNPPVMPKPPTPSVTAGAVASPLPSPGIRVKSSPKHKIRRNQSMDSKHKSQLFDFDGQMENNFCNNNNSKLARRHSSKPDDHTSRTPSRNSVSDELSSSSLTPTTDEQTNSAGGQNLELNAIFDNVNDEILHKVLKNIEKGPNDSLGLTDSPLDFDVSSFQNSSDALLYESNPLRTSQTELPSLEGLSNSPSSPKQYTSTVSANSTSVQGISQTAMASSTSSPASATKYSPPSSDSTNNKMGKSHLQDILGVTDTIRLKNMSRPIDTVPYKSPTTTTSYSATGMKPTPNTPATPSTMAPPNRLPSNMPFTNKPPRPQYMFTQDHTMYRPNSQGFMDNGANGPWSRGSPRHVPPNLLKSPPFPSPYVETPMTSLVNPMSGLQNTVDSIPAAPVGTSDPGTPVMGPPLRSPHSFEAATPSPGGGRMRPNPSPSVMNDKRCVSADSVSAANNGKKAGSKRERTRSADSKEEADKKETLGPKSKRRKSRSKDENITGKKESKTPGRNPKEEKLPRQDSALSGLLDVQTSNPYIYIFNTDVANKAASTVLRDGESDIILFHQSFLGNCKLRPSEHFKPKTSSSEQTTLSDMPSMSMPTTCRSPTEIPTEKSEPTVQKSPRTSPSHSNAENIQAINLQDTKPMLLPTPDIKPDPISEPVTSQPVVPSNGIQQQQPEELSAEKRRTREDKLEKLRKMQGLFLKENQEHPNMGNNNNPMPRGHGWPPGHPPHHPAQMHYGPMPMDERPPGMKEIPMPNDAIMPPSGQPMTQESAEWHQLIQKHNAEKRRQHEVGMRGDLPTRPPPPYGMSGPQPRWMAPEGYPVDGRTPMDPMNHPRLQRMGSGHRQLVRMPQDPRIPGGYMAPRIRIPHGPYPPNQQQRMPMYEPYMGPPGMRHPSRLPHPGHPSHPPMRQPSENYPFSEQLMKQASFYNSNMPPYDNEPQIGPEWVGPEGPQRLPHMPGSTSPAMGPQSMMNPMEMNPRMTPGMPGRGYEPHMGSYNPEMGQRYDVIPMGSPTGPMDARMRGPSGTSMMDAIARRGSQRPPDLNLSNQLPPRSPMNYHGQGPMPSPSVNAMSQPVRYPNPNDMGHPPQPSPMHTRSPQMVMGQHPLPMGPSSAGVETQQVMMGPGPHMGGGPPHSAGPLSNPPPNDWPGHNIPPGTPTPNSSMMHPGNMIQPSGMSSQPGMMSSQPGMMPGMQQPQPVGMMTSPVMMSQPGMMTSQSQGIPRMPNTPSSTKHTPNVLSIIKERMSSFKMPEKTPIYQDAVKDTATPPPMAHQNDAAHMSHNPMPVGMRMPMPNHPQPIPYDSRMGPPRMSAPHHMNENFQPGYPGGGHPSPMSGPPMAVPGGSGMVMNMGGHEHMGHPPNEYQQPRPNFPEMPEFDLRNILPSERPSQTISYLPHESNNDQFNSPGPGWGNEGIRPQPQLMPGPPHIANRPPML